MKLNGEKISVVLEIRIGREYGPATGPTGCADESIHHGNRNPLRPACVAHPSRRFVVRSFKGLIRKRPQRSPEFFVLLSSFDARQELLPNDTKNAGPALSD